jgi:hypothetical protein
VPYPIKGIHHVQIDKNPLILVLVVGMNGFLHKDHVIQDMLVFKKNSLARIDEFLQKWLDSVHKEFGENFVGSIA